MIKAIADHIISPLGTGTEANLQALLAGASCIRTHAAVRGKALMEGFVGSIFERIEEIDGYSDFESLCIQSVAGAVEQLPNQSIVSQADCIFILSSTKGNIWTSMAESAQKIARYFGNETAPIVVSTACTSGVSAQVVAYRLLQNGNYKTAVVIGCDVQCEFIVSGFQSFKALSDEACKPFDAQRKGLNAGEAAASMILTVEHSEENDSSRWTLLGGSIHNDANHISGPSRTAEGSLRCLEDAKSLLDKANIAPCSDLACISVHGTGTNYNDEMESIAIHRAGLEDVPVSALKGYYGHTMGAAGLMETILTMHAIDRGIILPSRGFEEKGTTYPVQIQNAVRPTSKQSFIKLLSGFGGVNAGIAWTKVDVKHGVAWTKEAKKETTLVAASQYTILAETTITKDDDLVALYREHVGNYAKFFKMDTLSRLGFMAVEMLKKQLPADAFDEEKTAIILANHHASLQNDTAYQETIADKNNYFPSPALFVYTLPNIVTGELAIRHHLYGETAFYVLENEAQLMPLVEVSHAESVIVGWVEAKAKDDYFAHVMFVKKCASEEN